jgi:SAM-dependent methyltransferase
MRIRESGMPEEDYWESLFDVELILDRLGIDSRMRDVVELGCGYGTFTLPVAKRIGGVIRTFDIDPEMVERTRRRAEREGLSNVRAGVRDVTIEGFGGRPGTRDACLLFNILHLEAPEHLLSMAACAVRPGGAVLAIHWLFDPSTPRGPSMAIRPRPEQIVDWARGAGKLQWIAPALDLPPWHYGLKFVRLKEPDPGSE